MPTPDDHILHGFSAYFYMKSLVHHDVASVLGANVRSRTDWKRELRLLLSRRLAFCGSRIATTMLAALRADGDATDAYLAGREPAWSTART